MQVESIGRQLAGGVVPQPLDIDRGRRTKREQEHRLRKCRDGVDDALERLFARDAACMHQHGQARRRRGDACQRPQASGGGPGRQLRQRQGVPQHVGRLAQAVVLGAGRGTERIHVDHDVRHLRQALLGPGPTVARILLGQGQFLAELDQYQSPTLDFLRQRRLAQIGRLRDQHPAGEQHP